MASVTRARMIETTARLLQHRGYYGTSLSDILSGSAAPRGSLYFHFPGGKDQLVLEATRGSIALATEALEAALRAAPTPGAGVRRYAEAAADLLLQTDFTFGCPVAPVILDAAGQVAELERLCREALDAWTAAIEQAARAGGVAAKRAASLAVMAVSAIEGALVLARARRDVEPLRQVGRELEALFHGAAAARSASRARRKA
jgi:TetR/AcrR family transcriptional repressor of lmrAB and yxaGH operons